jgi:hypothetical protein
MKFDVHHDGEQVTVTDDGSTLLKIYTVERIRGDKIVKELSIGLSACLVGGFAESEAQARAYVAAFDLAKQVLKSE